MTVEATTPIELVNGVYATIEARLAVGRERLGRSLTLAEKILFNHLDAAQLAELDAAFPPPKKARPLEML